MQEGSVEVVDEEEVNNAPDVEFPAEKEQEEGEEEEEEEDGVALVGRGGEKYNVTEFKKVIFYIARKAMRDISCFL